MKLNRFEDANQFYDRVKDYLLEREAELCLLLRIINQHQRLINDLCIFEIIL
ncbi:MAG: hypothetical protein AB4038_08005 [Prochloraceae cyanobacterium]